MASCVPCTRTLTEGGEILAVNPFARFRGLTGTFESCFSAGAGRISTDTTAVRALLMRTPSSATPTTALDRTSDLADPTHIGSVIASVTLLSTLSGPMTSTTAGSAAILPTSS